MRKLSTSRTAPTLAMLLVTASAAGAGAEFTPAEIAAWRERSFEGATEYSLVDIDGREALSAVSHGEASCLYSPTRIDLRRTPILRWSWRIDSVLDPVDERSVAGDDFAARVYVVVAGPLGPLTSRTLVYVWSNDQPVDTVWSNPQSDRARYIAVRSGDGRAGEWLEESRDVRADLERVFGRPFAAIDAVAVMTDADDTGQVARAWYGALAFERVAPR